MLVHQNEHFIQDSLQFSLCVASKSMFSQEFSYEPQNLLPQNRCFVRGFRQFSSHLTKWRLPRNLHLVATWRFAKHTQHDTSEVLRLPRKMSLDPSKVLRLPHKTTFDTLQTRLKVTKCHTCHAKRSNATCETSKSDPFCRTYHRHGHRAITRTVANGCGRLRTVVGNVERTHPQPPDPQSETGTLATHSGKTSMHPCPAVGRC